MGNLVPMSVRRSLDVDNVFSPPGGSSGSGSSLVTSPSSSGGHYQPQPASSSLAASMLLLRPRAFARQLSDDLRRRRESYAAGQYGTSPSGAAGGGASSCYSPLAAHSSSYHHHHLHHHHHRHHRHSVGGLQLLPGSTNSLLLQPGARLHPAAIAAAGSSSHATGKHKKKLFSFINSNPRAERGTPTHPPIHSSIDHKQRAEEEEEEDLQCFYDSREKEQSRVNCQLPSSHRMLL